MIQAVKDRAMISIRVPSNNRAVLDYLATEISCLFDENLPFLLILDSVNIGNSLLRNIVANPNPVFAKILSGNSIQELYEGMKEEGGNALGQMAKIILFQCANVVVAGAYSEMIGSYLRKFVSVSENKSRAAFDFFSEYGKGKSISEQDYARIKPEELVQLGEGAVLINQTDGTVEMVKRFIY